MKKQKTVFGTRENKLWETEKKLVSGGGGGGEEKRVAHNKGRGDHKVKQKLLIGSYISSLPENA